MAMLRLGEVSIDSILEWRGVYRDPLEMFPDATAEAVAVHRDWLGPDHLDPHSGWMIMAFRSYLVRTARLTILVDACVGNGKHRPLRPDWHRQEWPWLRNLAAAGVQPEDVDVVMCTHLHTDHVGWNTRREDGQWVPTFPNARYLFHRREYDFWLDQYRDTDWLRDAFVDSVLPVVDAGQADLVPGDHEIDHGLWLEPCPGHTPGAVNLHLASGPDHGIFCGDLVHHPLQVAEPQWSTIFCTDPLQSRLTREAFVERHADSGTRVLPAHFAADAGGFIVDSGSDGLRFV
jgi:glyoxylase-like metal-dependent hydrolase (beta-lactamase superfamily II)